MKTSRLFLLFALIALPIAAFAHAHLEQSTPKKNSVQRVSPPEVMLMFSDTVYLKSLTINKSGEKAARPLSPLPQAGGRHLTVPLPRLDKGEYTLSYVAESDDFHETKGSIKFTVDPSAPETTGAEKSAPSTGTKHDH